MLRSNFWCWSAARAEIDHRARDARLRLEHLERLLVSRVAPTRSPPRQVPDGQVLRFFRGGCVQNGQTTMAPRATSPIAVLTATGTMLAAMQTSVGKWRA